MSDCGSLSSYDLPSCAIFVSSFGPSSIFTGLRNSVRQSHNLGSFSNNDCPNFSQRCLKANSDPRRLIKPSIFDLSSLPEAVWPLDLWLLKRFPIDSKFWSSTTCIELIIAAWGVSVASVHVNVQRFLVSLSLGPGLRPTQLQMSSASASAALSWSTSSWMTQNHLSITVNAENTK